MKKHLVIDMSFFTVSFPRLAPSRIENKIQNAKVAYAKVAFDTVQEGA